jgi:hypothetical protein
MGNPHHRDGAEQQADRNENKYSERNNFEHVQDPSIDTRSSVGEK